MATVNEHKLSGWIRAWENETNNVAHFMLKTAISDGHFMTTLMDETVLGQYTEDLASYLVQTTLTEKERQFYAYNPRLLAYDLYGIPELWYLILYANELASMLDFNLPVIKFHNVGVLTLLTSIRELQRPYMNQNEQELHDIKVNGRKINDDIKVQITRGT